MSQETYLDGSAVIDAIKTRRHRAANLAPGTSAGVATDRVWEYVSEVYTPEQFATVLQQLLDSGEVMAMSRVRQVNDIGFPSDIRKQLTTTVPDGVDFSKRYWCIDADGNGFEPGDRPRGAYELLVETTLYVKEDGLPNRVKKLLAKTAA